MLIKKRRQTQKFEETKSIQLDPEKFRNLENFPYTGNTDEDFLKYLSQNSYNLEDNDDELRELLDDETYKNFYKLTSEPEYEHTWYDGNDNYWYTVIDKNNLEDSIKISWED